MAERLLRALSPNENPPVSGADAARKLLFPLHVGRTNEAISLVLLDRKGRPIDAPQVVSVGSDSACIIDSHTILGIVLRAGARAFLVAHNHPSGDPAPSAEDLVVTRRLTEAARVVGVQLVDHIILTDQPDVFSSLAARGQI
jgi:DNA repair protein RadC